VASKFSFNSLFNSVSKLIADEQASETKLNPQQKAHQLEIENALLVLAAEVVRCDKNLNTDTEKFIHHFMERQFGGTGSKRRMQTVSNHLEIGTEPFTK